MRLNSSFFKLLLFILSFIGQNVYSQNDKTNKKDSTKSSLYSNVFTGGNFGIQFGTETSIEISPILGYRITKKITTGLGVSYRYYRFKDYNYLPPQIFKTTIYGGSIFARYYILDNIFLHGEYEVLSLEKAFFDPGSLLHKNNRFLIGSLLGGGGYRQKIGVNSYINLIVLYNFNETFFSPYSNPVIKIGIDLGF